MCPALPARIIKHKTVSLEEAHLTDSFWEGSRGMVGSSIHQSQIHIGRRQEVSLHFLLLFRRQRPPSKIVCLRLGFPWCFSLNLSTNLFWMKCFI